MRTGLVIFCAIGLSACATTGPTAYYALNDGSLIAPEGAQASKFQTDKTVCQGETAKADLGGTIVETGNLIEDGVNAGRRDVAAEQVMAGCMAAKGYKLVSRAP